MSRQSCCIPNCKSKDRKKETELSFHKFPTSPVHLLMRNGWTDIVRQLKRDQSWEPGLNTFICSRHFPSTSIAYKGNGRQLVGQPLPVLHLEEVDETLSETLCPPDVDIAPVEEEMEGGGEPLGTINCPCCSTAIDVTQLEDGSIRGTLQIHVPNECNNEETEIKIEQEDDDNCSQSLDPLG